MREGKNTISKERKKCRKLKVGVTKKKEEKEVK